jgi:L-asparaginase
VFIAYYNDGEPAANIHRAIRALPHLPFSDDLFSLKNKPYGYVKSGVFMMNPEYRENESEFEVLSKPIDRSVLYLRPYPGMIYPELTDEYKAVLLDSYHSGTVGTASEGIKIFCKTAEDKNIPVYLTGSEQGFNYESKQKFSGLGIKLLPPMSPAAAYMKLWLL